MKKGVLLVNLGSPDSTEVKDVKRYLDQFLMDERVIDVPYLVRAFIVRGIILRTRPKKSAEAYKRIWWEEGSPLIVLTERLQKSSTVGRYPCEYCHALWKSIFRSGNEGACFSRSD